jgi:hypothetical protein
MARKTREIEEILKNAHIDPRLIMIICELAERMKVQHSQINELAAHQGKMIDLIQTTQNQMGGLGGKLDKLGITDQIKQLDNQDDEPDDTHAHSRRRNH